MASAEEQLKILLEQLQNDVNESLVEEVGEFIKDKEQEHIITDVYDMYSPEAYLRRGANDGLMADENIIISPIKNGVRIENIASVNPYYEDKLDMYQEGTLADIVEEGTAYDLFNKKSAPYLDARPFRQNVVDELEATEEHANVLSKSLKRKGYKIK